MIPNCDYYSTILQDITFEPTQDPKIELDQIASTTPAGTSNLTEKHRLECPPSSSQKQQHKILLHQQRKMKFSKFLA